MPGHHLWLDAAVTRHEQIDAGKTVVGTILTGWMLILGTLPGWSQQLLLVVAGLAAVHQVHRILDGYRQQREPTPGTPLLAPVVKPVAWVARRLVDLAYLTCLAVVVHHVAGVATAGLVVGLAYVALVACAIDRRRAAPADQGR